MEDNITVTPEVATYIQGLQNQLDQVTNSNHQLSRSNNSLFGEEAQDNLIRWQLDLKEDLDRIYHLLRGDKIIESEEGTTYEENEDPESKPFNEFGVKLLMNIMSFYLNRNTILSNYDEETINWKVHDFGIDLSDLIHNRYEDMMITTKSKDTEVIRDHLANKLKLYPMVVRELVDTVHSAYLRAYNGGERESLRTARTVTQTEPLGSNINMGFQHSQNKSKWFNPLTWGKN